MYTRALHAFYKNCVKEFIVSSLLVLNQNDGYNCGLFAIAFAAEILDEKSSMEARSHVERRAKHFLKWKENARPLDQLISHTIPKGLIPFKCIKSNHWKVFYKRKCGRRRGRGLCGISNHWNPVRKFAIFPVTEPIK